MLKRVIRGELVPTVLLPPSIGSPRGTPWSNWRRICEKGTFLVPMYMGGEGGGKPSTMDVERTGREKTVQLADLGMVQAGQGSPTFLRPQGA